MNYISTRGEPGLLSFSKAVMTGLARDGGLLLPAHFPCVRTQVQALQRLSYPELAFEVMRPYVDIPDDAFRQIIRASYAAFRDPEIAPLRTFGDIRILELFHGPTLAFKDIALQFLGNLFEFCLQRNGGRLNIMAATSGDTGSAAIHGIRGRDGIRIFVMHPKGRTSLLQELQMTTVMDANVHNLAVAGTFDDCQALVKALLNDLDFRDRYSLGSVNSINWARVLAQVVYFAWASLRVTAETGAERVRFSVPTGNFGDIFAGYVAAQMGFPIGKLVLATNVNDILTRFFSTGEYRMAPVVPTLSPSMDIQVASNFERYLYYRLGENPESLKVAMHTFMREGVIRIAPDADGTVDSLITAASADTSQTLASIRLFYCENGYLLDPHTATGYHAARLNMDADEPMICLATAHPAKFPDAIKTALEADIARHPLLDVLIGQPVRCDDIAADADVLKAYVAERA